MDYTILIRPLIGAGIGYVTNWIAVKMLFRPLNPVRIGKFTIPFTPGIIPKNKSRIAESIGDSISENLLTEETLKKTLLSEEMKLELKNKIIKILDTTTQNANITSKELISDYINEENYLLVIKSVKDKLSQSIYQTILNYNIGKIVSEQFEIAAREKLKGSIIGIFGGNSIISSISENAQTKVNDYITTNGKEVISNMIDIEVSKYESMNISDISSLAKNSEIDLISIVINIYESLVTNKLPNVLKALNISKIVQDKINEMDTLELEKLLLDIMRKELNALVSLGAIIGFILGCLNLLF